MPLIMGVLGQKEYVLLRCGVFFADIGMDRPAGQFIWIYITDSC